MHPDREDMSGEEGPPSASEGAAAEWLVRQDCGLTPVQQQEFDRWLQADPRHAGIYAEVARTWDLLGRVRALPPVAAGAKAPHPRSRRTGMLLWPAAAAAAGIVFFTWQGSGPTAQPATLTASTEVGEMRKVPLPDGSLVQLNTDSAIAVEFTATGRRVRLARGEAHFQVAKNPACPFVVSAGVVAVRAVGTAFDVRRRPDAVEVDDTVGGKSLLATAVGEGEKAFLAAGQRAYIRTAGAAEAAERARVETVTPAEIGQVLAWQSHRLEFVAAPLAEMVEEFNRYNRHKLVIADPRLAARRFGGTFPAGDYEEFVRLLESDFGVVAERGENEIRLRLAP